MIAKETKENFTARINGQKEVMEVRATKEEGEGKARKQDEDSVRIRSLIFYQSSSIVN